MHARKWVIWDHAIDSSMHSVSDTANKAKGVFLFLHFSSVRIHHTWIRRVAGGVAGLLVQSLPIQVELREGFHIQPRWIVEGRSRVVRIRRRDASDQFLRLRRRIEWLMIGSIKNQYGNVKATGHPARWRPRLRFPRMHARKSKRIFLCAGSDSPSKWCRHRCQRRRDTDSALCARSKSNWTGKAPDRKHPLSNPVMDLRGKNFLLLDSIE